jgi:hypothetical protein
LPFYKKIDENTPGGKRTLERLLSLRAGLDQEIPKRTLYQNLLLATRNIRDFDKPAYGEQVDEAFYYIAEISSHFDLVALQEVYRDLTGLDRVMDILGSHWKRIYTDATEGTGGNDERLAFVYDTRKVSFGGLAEEMILPDVKDAQGVERPVTQLARTPFVVGFDFGMDGLTFQQIVEAEFIVPEELLAFRSNAQKTRHYDQIAFRVRPGSLDQTGKAGVFDYYKHIFCDLVADRDIYTAYMKNTIDNANQSKSPSKRSLPYDQRTESGKSQYYRTYCRTHQISDHLPMWVELRIDYLDEYLTYKLGKSPI